MVFSTIFLIGSALTISAQTWRWFLVAGCVTKLGLGIAQTTLIVYLAEIAPFQLRGTGMAAYQLFLAGGQLFGAIATQIQVKTNIGQWRPLIASEFVFTGVGSVVCVGTDAKLFVLMLPFVPESPIYHIRKGHAEKAVKCMTRLYGTAPNYDAVCLASRTKNAQLMVSGSRISSAQGADRDRTSLGRSSRKIELF